MKAKGKDRFSTIRSEGGLLPVDFLERIFVLDTEIDGLAPNNFHLLEHEKISEAVNRCWERLLGGWLSFKKATTNVSESEPLTKETRERWLLPLFETLGYGRLVASKTFDVHGKPFPISHFWQNTPIHLVGKNVDLDRRTSGVSGAARSTPHGLVQEFLNRSEEHLWGIVSNGRKLRILRDNVSLTRQAYVEFDLEGMMDGEQFADFKMLWLLCHQSRVESSNVNDCWLERWSRCAIDTGIRVRDQLRSGVEEALTILGTGFLKNPANNELRSLLQSGSFSQNDYYRQLLRTIYRLLFLFVSEDRDLLLDPQASFESKKVYRQCYSTQRLRELAVLRKGTLHHDLWITQQIVFRILGTESGCADLALPALGSFLWSPGATNAVDKSIVSNRVFLDAVRALAFAEEGNARRPVDFKNLKSEELGSIYEALLEMHPQVDLTTQCFSLVGANGSERKTTGSYYTPASLVSSLLDTALSPVLDRITQSTNAASELLQLRICDPACGSGHFLIAASHRVAKALAGARSEDPEPSPQAYRSALRDVISHCIYGVDINEMSVELCKVNLWLESIDPGKPFSFLDDKIKCGNSLFGATPALLLKGIPDQAFDPIEGDDKTFAKTVKARNKEQRSGQLSLLDNSARQHAQLAVLHSHSSQLHSLSDDSIQKIKRKEEKYFEVISGNDFRRELFVCDAWCSAFVWEFVSNVVFQHRSGGLFLFDTIDKFDSLNQLSKPFWSIQTAPTFLCRQR